MAVLELAVFMREIISGSLICPSWPSLKCLLIGCPWLKVSSCKRAQGTGPERATEELVVDWRKCSWLRPGSGIWSI
eukprot:3945177-Heterocapsa_arctica.AAC.1